MRLVAEAEAAVAEAEGGQPPQRNITQTYIHHIEVLILIDAAMAACFFGFGPRMQRKKQRRRPKQHNTH